MDISGTNPYETVILDDYSRHYGVPDVRLAIMLAYRPLPQLQVAAGVNLAVDGGAYQLSPRSLLLDGRYFPWSHLPLYANARLDLPIATPEIKTKHYGSISLGIGSKFDWLAIPLPAILEDLSIFLPYVHITLGVGGRLDLVSTRPSGGLEVLPAFYVRIGLDI